ncbi:MAG: DEAD/DEAH box helicase [Chlamydiota bacterium]
MSRLDSNSLIFEICLSPNGVLYVRGADKLENSPPLRALSQAFTRDWREGLLYMAANRIDLSSYPVLKFWQSIAVKYLTEVCHLPEENEFTALDIPEVDLLNDWIIKSPPMTGGEYLSLALLRQMWCQLNLWIDAAARKHEGIHLFLQKWAPKWQQVGKVCFHLAENKKDSSKPFAFLATYSTGFNVAGRLKHLPLRKALEQYSASHHHQALVKLLTPVQKAAECCLWVKGLLDTAKIYHPLTWSIGEAYKMLQSVPQLEESGLSVRIPNWWKKRSRPQVLVTVGSKKQAELGVNAMLDFQVDVALGQDELSQEELHELVHASEKMVYLRGQWVEVDSNQLGQALAHWKEVKKRVGQEGISFIDGMRLLAGAPSSIQGSENSEEEREWINVSAGKALAKLLGQLKDPSLLPMEKALTHVHATLRPYQQEGVSWLCLLSSLGLGACLADDMGLGKTLQILSLLTVKKKRGQENRRSSLLIVPASLLGNWKEEAKRFAPFLELLFVHPSETKQRVVSEITAKHLDHVDAVVTTYAMTVRQQWLAEIKWDLVILDEAQAIKNSSTKQACAVKNLKAFARIALTGTPIENRLSDLWSLFDFLNPGLLGSATRFKNYIKQLQAQANQFEPLRRLIAPYILRRMKTDPKIISDLPDKIETFSYCQLTKQQVHLYQAQVNSLAKSLETVAPIHRRGLILQTLICLKQICNHPAQLSKDGDYNPLASGKFIRLKELCEELAVRQEKVLVFTQFSEIIPALVDYLSTIFNCPGLFLHGGTAIKERKKLVQEFQEDQGPPFFVLSLKAGGTGLTLTAASHVVHFDRWWNPAVENQATDRAFRIGQKKNVLVHKFITQGTIEEKIDKMIASKQALSSELLNTSDEVKFTEMQDEELLRLVALDISQSETTVRR